MDFEHNTAVCMHFSMGNERVLVEHNTQSTHLGGRLVFHLSPLDTKQLVTPEHPFTLISKAHGFTTTAVTYQQ